MSSNYEYIIAGLPVLVLNSEGKDLSIQEIKDNIYNLCSDKDKRLIDWLYFGNKEDNLSHVFYKSAIKKSNQFISSYFLTDLTIRNKKVSYLAAKNKKLTAGKENDESKRIERYTITLTSQNNSEVDIDSDNKLSTILEIQNIIERENALDKFRWEKINDSIIHDYFNINVILAFLAKLQLVERWSKMDKTIGTEMFKKLVNEVRGTYKGIDENLIK